MWLKQLFSHQDEELPWLGFSLSQTHSCADYIFCFGVCRKENGRYYVTGECCDDNGYRHIEEKGIRLKKQTVEALSQFRLEQLPKEVPRELTREMMDVFVLDEMTRDFVLHLPDGSFESKIISEEMFLDIAHRLKAYLMKS